MITVLTPKRITETRGISFLETLWKVVEAIINTSLKVCITFHDVLHVLLKGRGPVTAILELKLNQELTSINQDPILLMFLDLSK